MNKILEKLKNIFKRKKKEAMFGTELEQDHAPKKFQEFFYFASRNTKLKIGLVVFILFLLWGLLGPLGATYTPRERVDYAVSSPPSSQHIFGTTKMKEDVYSQFVYGLRSAFLIGALGGTLATLIGLFIGFISGYIGGWLDEILMMLTNILLVIPVIAIFLIIATYVESRGVLLQALILGCIQWPWIARSVRSQTLMLKQRGHVSLSRITGVRPIRIIIEEIAPKMMSYVVMIFIILFGATILYSSALDFIGLGPTKGMSLGLMMQESFQDVAIQYNQWWRFFPPGVALMLLISSMYFMNTGLDEVFNPKLREL